MISRALSRQRRACSRDYVTADQVMTAGPGLEPGLVAEPEL
jgi:hypothetical protein